jgi:CheY-like chemotaxis protein
MMFMAIRVLLVEDNMTDVILTRMGLDRAFSDVHLEIIYSEIEFFNQFERLAADPPDLLFTDLNLPWSGASDKNIRAAERLRYDLPAGESFGGEEIIVRWTTDSRTQHVPIILSTSYISPRVFAELPKAVYVLNQASDSTVWFADLCKAVKSVLSTRAVPLVPRNHVFIMHGHDRAAMESVGRLVERFGLESVILFEQENRGQTDREA